MAFHWQSNDSVAIDSLVTAVLSELINNGGYTDTDSGYCVTDPNAVFDLAVSLEVTNKRYLQFQIATAGTWNAGSHTMGTPRIDWGHLVADTASGHPAGTETGTFKMSYDDYHMWLATDYQANGADFRNCLTYGGLLFPLDTTDECIVGGSTLFRGTNAIPTNDATNPCEIVLLKDISGSAIKPIYDIMALTTVNLGASNSQPNIRILSSRDDKRRFINMYVHSTSANPAGGENAGLRAYFRNAYPGGAYDAETYGQTILASDNKEYYYFIQADSLSYPHFCTRMLIRKD